MINEQEQRNERTISAAAGCHKVKTTATELRALLYISSILLDMSDSIKS